MTVSFMLLSRQRHRRAAVMLLMALTALMAVACGADEQAPSGPPADAAKDFEGRVMSGLRGRSFASLEEMASASHAVVAFTATDQARTAVIGDIPFTVTTAMVDEVIAGRNVGSTIEVRQMGAPGVMLIDGLPLLQPGDRYIGFLFEETFASESPEPQYWPVESSGLFALDTDTARHLDPESRLDSEVVVLTELRARVEGSIGG